MNKEELIDYKLETLRHVVKKVTGRDVLTKSREREVVDARRIFCHIAYNNVTSFSTIFASKRYVAPRISHERLGKFLGLDHSTVLFAVRSFEDVIKSDPIFKNEYERVYANIGDNNGVKIKYLKSFIKDAEANLKILNDELEAIYEKQKHEENNLPRQGVLFEIPEDN